MLTTNIFVWAKFVQSDETKKRHRSIPFGILIVKLSLMLWNDNELYGNESVCGTHVHNNRFASNEIIEFREILQRNKKKSRNVPFLI